MSRALSPYNRFVASHAKPGRSMSEVAAMWRSSGHASRNSPAHAAKARAEHRWTHNPPGSVLGVKLPAFLGDVNPLDLKNLKNVGALAGAAVFVIGAPMFAGSWNTGIAGIGLTAAAAGVATGITAMAIPALAVPVGAMGLGLVVLRGVIYFVPRAVAWIVTPLLGWAGAAAPVASSAAAGAAAGPQGGYTHRLIEGYARKQLVPPQGIAPVTVGAGASHVADRNF